MNLGFGAPEESLYGRFGKIFEEKAEEYTNGSVDVKLRCCNQISSEDEAFKAMQLGTVDGFFIKEAVGVVTEHRCEAALPRRRGMEVRSERLSIPDHLRQAFFIPSQADQLVGEGVDGKPGRGGSEGFVAGPSGVRMPVAPL